MTDGIEISSSLQEWANLAGYTLTPASTAHDGRALFWSAGGEVRLFIESRGDGWFIVTRSDRLGEEHFEFAAKSSTTLDKYLFGSFGQSIRSNRGLPVIPMPRSLDEVSAGFSVDTRQFDGIERLGVNRTRRISRWPQQRRQADRNSITDRTVSLSDCDN
jgi:hypothetical protein